jgi:hypothetical protein
MASFSDGVAHRKNVKRGFVSGTSKLGKNPVQTLYDAQDLHQRESMGASAGQAFVPDWNAGSSLFSPKLRRR